MTTKLFASSAIAALLIGGSFTACETDPTGEGRYPQGTQSGFIQMAPGGQSDYDLIDASGPNNNGRNNTDGTIPDDNLGSKVDLGNSNVPR